MINPIYSGIYLFCNFGPLFATFKTNREVTLRCMNIYQMGFHSTGYTLIESPRTTPDCFKLRL